MTKHEDNRDKIESLIRRLAALDEEPLTEGNIKLAARLESELEDALACDYCIRIEG
jgi:hypothetical protein